MINGNYKSFWGIFTAKVNDCFLDGILVNNKYWVNIESLKYKLPNDTGMLINQIGIIIENIVQNLYLL